MSGTSKERNVEDEASPLIGATRRAAPGSGVLRLLPRSVDQGIAARRGWPMVNNGGPILPLVERLTSVGSALKGEPGVSYLIRAGGMRVLFDLRAVCWQASIGAGTQSPHAGRAVG